MEAYEPIIEKINSYWKSKFNDQSKRSGADFATILYMLSKGASESSLRKMFEDSRVNLSQKYLERKSQNPSAASAYLEMTLSKAKTATQITSNGEDPANYRLDAFNDVESVRTIPNNLTKAFGIPGIYGLTILSGPPKVTKSWFGVSAVRDAVLAGSKVLILDFENGPYRTRSRLSRAFPEYQKYLDSIFYWPGNDFSIEKLKQLVMLLGVDFILIDPIQKMSRNADNYFGELRQYLAALEDMKKTGEVAILGISQIKREEYAASTLGSGFGSNSIEYNSDLLLTLRQSSGTISLIVLASRDWSPNKPSIQLDFGAKGLEPAGSGLANRDAGQTDEAFSKLVQLAEAVNDSTQGGQDAN